MTDIILSDSKTGAGEFTVIVHSDGNTVAGVGGNPHEFKDQFAAYHYFRPMADRGHHGAWNICYALEGLMEDVA